MQKRNRVHSCQLFGLFFLLLALIGILFSCVHPDWQRSISKISNEKAVIAFKNGNIKKNTLLKLGYVCREIQFSNQTNIANNDASMTDCRQKFNFSSTSSKTLKLQQKWRIVGFKGLWNECAYLPTSLLSTVSLVSSRKSLSSNEINVIHHSSAEKFNQSDKLYKKLPRTKQCTCITLDKSSCLLLGIRTMVFLSIICGTLSVILAFVSILNDSTIRARSRSYRFRHRNAMSVLSGVTASLSGILALIGCWWFTLKSSSHFLIPSYQHEHDESGAIFVWGYSLLVAVGSGLTYVVGGILLGVHFPQLYISYFVECKGKICCNSRFRKVAFQTQC